MEEITVYLIYSGDEPEQLKAYKELFPSEVSLIEIAYQERAELDIAPEALVLTYLGDEALRSFLPMAIDKGWKLGLLPHKELALAERNFMIEPLTSENIPNLFTEKATNVDVLFCNETLVFRWVKLGQLLSFGRKNQKFSLMSEGLNLLRGIFGLKKLKHFPLTILVDNEVVAETSALGGLAVEHGDSSIMSAKLVSERDVNDGLVNVIILSPKSLLDVIGYLFSSWLGIGSPSKLPDFMGYLKNNEVLFRADREIPFSVDGQDALAKEIRLEVKKGALQLVNPGMILRKAEGNQAKKSLKLQTLPGTDQRTELIKRNLPFLPKAGQEEFKEVFNVLRENARTSSSYLVMMMLSTLIAAFGLYGDSSPVIIGAMILAPLMAPLVSFSMGIIRNDFQMMKISFRTIFIGTTLAMFAATFVSLIIPLKVLTGEMNSRLSPNLLDLGIAVASGIAAAFVHAREEIAKSLAGVAIAVALIPPLAVAGIGIGWMDWNVFSGAFLLYLTNLAGIILFGGLTFWLLGFAPFKRARRNLIYTLITVLIICIPLTLAYSTIVREARISRDLEGLQLENITIKDVKPRVLSKGQAQISLRIVAEKNISDFELRELKSQIEEKLGLEVKLEITSSAIY